MTTPIGLLAVGVGGLGVSKQAAEVPIADRVSHWAPAVGTGALTALSLVPTVRGVMTGDTLTRVPASLTTAGLGVMSLANIANARRKDIASLEKAEAEEMMQALLQAQKVRRAKKPERKGWFGGRSTADEESLAKAAADIAPPADPSAVSSAAKSSPASREPHNWSGLASVLGGSLAGGLIGGGLGYGGRRLAGYLADEEDDNAHSLSINSGLASILPGAGIGAAVGAGLHNTLRPHAPPAAKAAGLRPAAVRQLLPG